MLNTYREPRAQYSTLLLLPAGLIALFFNLSLLPRVQQNENLVQAFWWSGSLLLLFYGFTIARLWQERLQPQLEIVICKPHYVQAVIHLAIYAYWGWHWRQVYEQAALILAQLVFVHSFDLLLRWYRGKPWILGFGRFPIIFSTNLFLWFRDDWFILQFAMIAAGVLGKEFITWTRDGRRTHIFNPSAFSLSVASLFLILTGTTRTSWGLEISNTLAYPEHMYLWIFLLGLVVQYLFSVTLVTLVSAMTLFAFSMAYLQWTGVYFFITSDIPIAVFLGLHLLITDPATSPKTNIGRALFGALYGLGVVSLFVLLDTIGQPTFYDKLLCVPLLNLCVPLLDKMADRIAAIRIGWPLPQFDRKRLNHLHMGIWAVFFTALMVSGRLGNGHEGRQSAFWEQACTEDRPSACGTLVKLMDLECRHGTALACAKLGSLYKRGMGVEQNDLEAYRLIRYACDLGSILACEKTEVFRPERALP